MKLKEGVKVEFFEAADGDKVPTVWVKRARSEVNPKFQKVSERVWKPYQRRISTMTPAQRLPLLAEIYAESVLVKWENVTDENGNELEFNKENAVKILLDLPDMFDRLVMVADDVSEFGGEVDSKN